MLSKIVQDMESSSNNLMWNWVMSWKLSTTL
jgi:hypothetical protein